MSFMGGAAKQLRKPGLNLADWLAKNSEPGGFVKAALKRKEVQEDDVLVFGLVSLIHVENIIKIEQGDTVVIITRAVTLSLHPFDGLVA